MTPSGYGLPADARGGYGGKVMAAGIGPPRPWRGRRCDRHMLGERIFFFFSSGSWLSGSHHASVVQRPLELL
jgi:hypothetical protein